MVPQRSAHETCHIQHICTFYYGIRKRNKRNPVLDVDLLVSFLFGIIDRKLLTWEW